MSAQSLNGSNITTCNDRHKSRTLCACMCSEDGSLCARKCNAVTSPKNASDAGLEDVAGP